ncbi:MAG: hypothetical protein ACRDY6_06595 [Acidimicrobiia bacterium]
MKITGAAIKEQGVTFGVVLMRDSAFANVASRRQFHATAQNLPMFRGIPLVVATQTTAADATSCASSDPF